MRPSEALRAYRDGIPAPVDVSRSVPQCPAVSRMRARSVNAFLVGEAFLRAPDPDARRYQSYFPGLAPIGPDGA